MSIRWIFSITFLFTTLFSFSQDSKYVVYNLDMKKEKLNLKDTNLVVFLKHSIACIDCIPEMLKRVDLNKQIVFVVLSNKNKLAMKMEERRLERYLPSETRIYFQFQKQGELFEYEKQNKLFQDFHFSQSPVMLIPKVSGNPDVILPSQVKLDWTD